MPVIWGCSLLDNAPNYLLLDIIFSSNYNFHKSSCVLYFWASDPLIDRPYWNLSIKRYEAQKQRPNKLLWMLWFEEKSIYNLLSWVRCPKDIPIYLFSSSNICSSIPFDLSWNRMFSLSFFRLIYIQIISFDGFQTRNSFFLSNTTLHISIEYGRCIIVFGSWKIFVSCWSTCINSKNRICIKM